MTIDLDEPRWAEEYERRRAEKILAHLPGQHDQMSHGRGGGGGGGGMGGAAAYGEFGETADLSGDASNEFLYGQSRPFPNPEYRAPTYKIQASQAIAEGIGDEFDGTIMEQMTARRATPGEDGSYEWISMKQAQEEGLVAHVDISNNIIAVGAKDDDVSFFTPPSSTTFTEEIEPVMLREHYASNTLGQWAQSSNDHNGRSLALQEAARREFGFEGADDWDMDSNVLAERDAVLAAEGPLMQKVLRVQYDNTQAEFASKGFTSVELHRGVNGDLESAGMLVEVDNGVSFLKNRPLTSWSSDREVARIFAFGADEEYANNSDSGSILTAAIPASRILSIPRTGMGSLEEFEFVVLGSGRDRMSHVEEV